MALLEQRRDGSVLVVTLNRPDQLNALPEPEDGVAFAALADQVQADESIRCVVLTGAGRAFSAGGNVRAMQAHSGLFAGDGLTLRNKYRQIVHRIMKAVYGLDVPVIAAVNGPAVGLGCDLACLADLRIAGEGARFGVTFLRIGLIPGDGGAWSLPRSVSYARAAELLFTGKLIDARTAYDWGLVNQVVSDEHLLDEAMALAQTIAAQPGRILRLTKSLLRQGRESSFEAVMEMSAALQALAHQDPDHMEGINAFIERRDPVFKA